MDHLSTAERQRWITSSYSDNGGNCVEVALNLAGALGTVPLRDSKRAGGGPVLRIGVGAFTSFVAAVKAERG